MLLSYIRTIILYLILIAVVRLMGKRQIGQMEPAEFVVTMLVANLAAIPMQDGGIPLFSGVVPILTVLGVELVLATASLSSVWVRRALTFILVSFAWIFFRANSISDIGLIFKALFTNGGGIANTLGTMGFDALGILTVLFSIALLLMLDRMVSYELEGDGSSVLTRDGGFVIFVLLILLSFALLLSSGRASTFIYFQF